MLAKTLSLDMCFSPLPTPRKALVCQIKHEENWCVMRVILFCNDYNLHAPEHRKACLAYL